jgi:hypothetical protein
MSKHSDIVTRQESAYQNLIDTLKQYGAGDFAPEVANLYLKERIATLDVRMGKCQFKHGAFLESAIIERAISMVNS